MDIETKLFDLGVRQASLDVVLHAVAGDLLHGQLVAPLAGLLLLEMVLARVADSDLSGSSHVEALGSGLAGLELSTATTVSRLNGGVNHSRGPRDHWGRAHRVGVEGRRTRRDSLYFRDVE